MNKIVVHEGEKSPGTTYLYDCAQSEHNARVNVKHQDPAKHREKRTMPHFDCRGALKLVVRDTTNVIEVRYRHEIDHEGYECIDIPEEVIDIVKSGL